jgi:hypothetical protein
VVCSRKFLLRQIFEQRTQGTVEDRRDIATRDLMAQKSLGEAEPIVHLLAHRKLHSEALRRQWLDHGPAGRAGRGRMGSDVSRWRRLYG